MREHPQVLEESLPAASQGRTLCHPGPPPRPPPLPGRVISPPHSLDFLQVFVGVLVGHVGGADVELEVWPKVLEVVVVWKF